MHDNFHYIPILLTRRGERSALKDLRSSVKKRMTPLFTVHPRDWDFEGEQWKKTVRQHVEPLAKHLADCWPGGYAFVDLEHLDDGLDGPVVGDSLAGLVNEAAHHGTVLIPVVAPDRCPEYLAAAGALHKEHANGVCVRLKPFAWPSLPGAATSLYELLDQIEVDPTQVDLVLDLGDQMGSELAQSAVFGELLALPDAEKWRSLTLAGGSFPKDLAGMEKDTLHRVPRVDWQLYCRVDDQASQAHARRPAFGDYGVAHPDPFLMVDPKILNISGQLRYTVEDAWLVAKGGLFKRIGGEAVVPPARLVVKSDEFCGPDFSLGDKWIAQVAREDVGGSNPEHWRRVATDHHLTYVTGQLASRYGTSNES